MQPDTREQEREGAEDREELCEDALLGAALRDDLRLGAERGHRDVGIHPRHDVAEHGFHAADRSVGPHEDVVPAVGGPLEGRRIDRGRHRIPAVAIRHVVDHADDFEGWRAAADDPAADRVHSVQIPAHERLIDHRHARLAFLIVCSQAPAAQQRDPQSLEVPGADGLEIRVAADIRLVLERHGRAPSASHRKPIREGHGLHSRKGTHALLQALESQGARADSRSFPFTLRTAGLPGGTVELDPIGGSAAQGPIVLPPGSAGIVPDIGLGFDYLDPGATPTLQLTFDLGLTAADLLSAWLDGRFVMGLGVTNAAGVADLYLAGVDAPPQQGLPEPPTLALLSVPLLVLARSAARRRQSSAASFAVG